MLTIAHVTAPAAFGGLERVVAGLSHETAVRGHRVVLVLTLDEHGEIPAWANDLRGIGVILEPIRVPSRAYLAERRAVREILRRHAVDVVHTHGYRSDFLHVGVARAEKLPLVSTAHGFATTRGIGFLYEWLQKRAWRSFDAVVAVSRPLLEVLAAAGVARERLVFIRNGLSTGSAPLSRQAARERLGIPAEATCIGWVGRFSEEKDPALAIRALAAVQDTRVHMCMIGAGPMLEECRALIGSLGIGDRVRLAGAVPDAGPLLSAFDLLMLSSRTEGTPMVILEAALAAVPVVATAVGGVPDLLCSDGGWLAPVDAPSLTMALTEAVKDRAELARRGATLQQRHSPAKDRWVDEYLELYSRVIGA